MTSSPAGKGHADGQLRAVLFDMDGLLVDSEPLWFEAERAVMARMGGPWTEADQQQLMGGTLTHSVGYMRARALRGGRPPEQAGSRALPAGGGAAGRGAAARR